MDTPSRIISLFSGIGGLDLGIAAAFPGCRTVCHVEREAFAAAILAARMADGSLPPAPVWSDVTTFDAAAWRGRCDAVSAGWPCPPVSIAGKRAGSDDDRWLWPDVVRVFRESGARWLFLENVRGLLSANDLREIGEVLRDLSDMLCDAEGEVVSASEVGASHRRERIFILAYRESGERGLPESARRHDRARRRPQEVREGIGAHERREKSEVGHRGMADSRSERLQGDGAGRPEARATGRGSGTALADAGHGLAPLEGRGPEGREGTGSGGEGLPAFPPGPGAHEEWARILAVRPDLAPALTAQEETQLAFRSLAHGVLAGLAYTPRADALRALGNAVVPAQAEEAFLRLYARLTGHSA